MPRISRRSFVAAGAAGAALNAIPFSTWVQRQAFGQAPRVRHSAYSPQGKAMLVKYEAAVKRMMDHAQTPEGDPLSWTFQWYTHFTPPPGKASELARIYPQPSPHRALAQEMWDTCQAHNGQPEDYFLPWHRMYVYFFEEIIREKAQDPDFTLPYWNYSNPADAAIPPEFRVATSPLYRANRNPGVNTGSKIPANQVALTALKQKTYSPNGAANGFNATLDFGLHGNVHVWVGGPQNMGQVPYAARDPVFWMHHCNIDRLWASWNRGNCKNPGGSWDGKQFVFADTKGQKVVATIKDFDDIAKLRYTYDAFEPASCPPVVANLNPAVLASLASPTAVTRTPLRVKLLPAPPPPTGAAVPLPQQIKTLAPTKSVYLVLEDVHAAAPVNAHYDVYLDLAEGATPSPESPNYVGTINFFAVTMSPGMDDMKPRTFSLDVTDKIKALSNAGLSESPAVTLAPSGEPSEDAKPTIGQVQLAVQ